MGILSDITRAARSAVARIVDAADIPAVLRPAAMAPTSVPTLDEWDVVDVRNALRQHEQGHWARSALLADHMLRNDRIMGVFSALALGVISLPFSVQPAEGSTDRTLADAAAPDLRAALPRHYAGQVLQDVVFAGLSVCHRHYHLEPDGRWRITLEPWHLSWCRWDDTRRAVVVQTATGYEYAPLDNSDPRWFIFRDLGGDRPWMMGALRALAIPYLIVTWADRDWARWSEKHGLPPLGAKVPQGERFARATAAFLEDLQELATEPTILLPQGADGQVFDLDWKELKNWQSYQGFRDLAERQNPRIAIVLVGQNLSTEVQGGSFAAAQAHMVVRQDILAARALLLTTGVYEAAALPAHRLNVTEVEPERTAPRPVWDATPPEDEKARADSMLVLGQGIKALQDAGVNVDVNAEAARFGVALTPGQRDLSGQVFAWHVTTGVVTPDEARARLGLGPLPDGAGSKPTPTDVPRMEPDASAGAGGDPAVLSARTRSAPTMPTPDEIRTRLVDTIAQAVAASAPALAAALRAASSPEDMRARLAEVAASPLDPETRREVARAIVLARLVGRLGAAP